MNQFLNESFFGSWPDFIRFNEKINEDSFFISQKYPIFSVADGVTRSCLPNGCYLFSEGVYTAAKIFCENTVYFLEKNFCWGKNKIKDFSEIKRIFKEAFDSANSKIKKLNSLYGIDKIINYKEYDWLGTVGVVGAIKANRIFYGYVGDCFLAIFNKRNKKKFQTKDMVIPAFKNFAKVYKNWRKIPEEERTVILRRDFRNNPNQNSYGVFTGEKEVEFYYCFGEKVLEKGDLVIFFSDGFLPYFKDHSFLKLLREGNNTKIENFIFQKTQENPEIYGKDRTLIAINI